MRNVFRLIIATLFLTLCATVCSAQNCADTFQNDEVWCAGPDGCTGAVYPTHPNGSQYGLTIECSALDCCGQQITTCYGTSACDVLKKPSDKEQVNRLAATSDVLVADCKGRYALFQPRISEHASLATLNDHILR